MLLLALGSLARAEEPAVAEAAVVKKTIELEWEPVPNAFGYEVLLTPKGGGKPIGFRTLEARLSEEVPAGVYVLRIRSRHRDADLWSAWSDPLYFEVLEKDLHPLEPANESTVQASTLGREEVTFKWTPIEKAKDYTLKIWTEETKEQPLSFVTRHPSQRLKLLQGRVYFWQVTFESATHTSYAQQVRTFQFILQGAKLVQPSIVPLKPLEPPVKLSWIGSRRAKSYHAVLKFRFLDDEVWQTVRETDTTETSWEFGALKPGVYRLEVVAKAPRNADSDPGRYEFPVKPSPAAIQAL